MSNEENKPGSAEPGESEELLRQELLVELDELVKRLKALTPGYSPPTFAPRRLLALVEDKLGQLRQETRVPILTQLRDAFQGDLLDVETWRGLWYLINYTVTLQADVIKRRFTGEYETDEWGLDWELLESVIPFVNFLYETFWRVETSGIDNIPHVGPALLVSNHSGQLPWDGLMVAAAVWNDHPSQRLVRCLYGTWFATLPFLSPLLEKLGQVPATLENGTRLLKQEELVAVFPEGNQGISKIYRERYQVTRFGRGGFVKMALGAQAPLIPVAVIGAEETYISLGQSPYLARLMRLPHFPITLRFPWWGLLGLIPLPSKWYIDFGEPIPTDTHGPEAANDLMLISQLREQVRRIVQGMVERRLAERKSVFL